jgi:hypothetical protein
MPFPRAHKATEGRPSGRPKAARSSRAIKVVHFSHQSAPRLCIRHDAKRKGDGPLIAVSGTISMVSAPGLDRNHPVKRRSTY